MELADYFENTEGIGVLATADSEGNVDAALYARPHIIDEKNVVFIMNERLSYKNLASNAKAAYLFLEKGGGYKGKRLYLTKVRQETDPKLIDSIRRRPANEYKDSDSKKYLVYFTIDRIRALVGD